MVAKRIESKRSSNLSFLGHVAPENMVSDTPKQVGCVVSGGTRIEGDFHSAGDMRLDGYVKGTLRCDGRLILGAKGEIEGNLIATNANIQGRLTGDIQVKETLTLETTAFINGTIRSKYIAVQLGAIHNGECKVGISK